MTGRDRIANDVDRVMDQLRRASLCRTCLADVTGLERHTVNRVLITINATVHVTMTSGTCDRCKTEAVVHRID